MVRIPHSVKPAKTVGEQLDIFKSRGLIVEVPMKTHISLVLAEKYDGMGYTDSRNFLDELEYNNDMQIILGTNMRIKIASGTIKDGAGNLNEEMILQVTPPVIQSVAISDDNHDVTVTYDVYVYDNTSGTLKNNIDLVKDDDWKSLGEKDIVTFDGKELNIHFAEALTGSNNQIYINGNSIKDSLENVIGDDRITAVFQANDFKIHRGGTY